MSCDVVEAMESLENELFRFSYVTGFSLTSPGEPPMQELKLVSFPILRGSQKKIVRLISTDVNHEKSTAVK